MHLLPMAVERGVCIITNMGATNTFAAQKKVLELASNLGIIITVGLAHQLEVTKAGLDHHLRNVGDGISVYLGAAPIVECLEKFRPKVVITSRVVDAALFLAPMTWTLIRKAKDLNETQIMRVVNLLTSDQRKFDTFFRLPNRLKRS